LQISDFFQCKEALKFSIENMTFGKESATLNIREGLKKIQSIGNKLYSAEFKECWFMLIQKSIIIAA
jgi:hypothetical protein